MYNSVSMAKLGFLGLGLMGYPMARNLLRAGHDVALWSNTADKARKLASEESGKFCDQPQKWPRHADCIFLCVGTTAMSREVILGDNGVIEGAKPGMVVVDASTISPSESRQIGAVLHSKASTFSTPPAPVPLPERKAAPLPL